MIEYVNCWRFLPTGLVVLVKSMNIDMATWMVLSQVVPVVDILESSISLASMSCHMESSAGLLPVFWLLAPYALVVSRRCLLTIAGLTSAFAHSCWLWTADAITVSTSRSSSPPHRSLGLHHGQRYLRVGSAEDCVLVMDSSLIRGLGVIVPPGDFGDMSLSRCSEWVDVGFLSVWIFWFIQGSLFAWDAHLIPLQASFVSSLLTFLCRCFQRRQTAVVSFVSSPCRHVVESSQEFIVTGWKLVSTSVLYGPYPCGWKCPLQLLSGFGCESPPSTSSRLFLCLVAIGFQSVYINLALDFGAMDSSAVSMVLHETVFCVLDHILNSLPWAGTLVQIATIMVYEWTSWLSSMVPIDVVDKSTPAVVLQSTASCQPIDVLICRDVVGVSAGVSLSLSKYCHGFAHRDHLEFCGLWIDLREDLVYHGVVLEESTVTGSAEESNSPMLQESNVGFSLIEDLFDPSLPRSSKWIDCVLLPASCSAGFDWTEDVFDSLLAICIDWFMLIIDLVVLVLQKCNEWWIFTMIVDIVDMSSWTPWSCKGSLMIWISRLMHRCCDQMVLVRTTCGCYVFPVLCLFA